MTKQEFVAKIAEATQMENKQVTRIYDAICDEIKDTLISGEKFSLNGLGILKPDYRKPRSGRNPKTGESLEIEGKGVIRFRMSNELKALVNTPDFINKVSK